MEVQTEKKTDSWTKSRELLIRARGLLSGGVSSPFRAKTPVPLFFEDGCGCRLRNVDGNEYIDYALAWGPLFLGHRHPALVEALCRQAEKPHNSGARHPAGDCRLGAALAVHFTNKTELETYRNVLEDDTGQLNRYLMAALQEGLYLLPDGRIYVSAVHQKAGIEETTAKFDQAFSTR